MALYLSYFPLILVENLTVSVNDECNSFTNISWTLSGDGVMLSEVNFTITVTNSMGNDSIVHIQAETCMNETLGCGQHLTEFTYLLIDGLTPNLPYNVSISTAINETNSMHVVRTPLVSITANTTIPGKPVVTLTHI